MKILPVQNPLQRDTPPLYYYDRCSPPGGELFFLDKKQGIEYRRQRTEDRRQRTEDRGQKTEDRKKIFPPSAFCLLFSNLFRTCIHFFRSTASLAGLLIFSQPIINLRQSEM